MLLAALWEMWDPAHSQFEPYLVLQVRICQCLDCLILSLASEPVECGNMVSCNMTQSSVVQALKYIFFLLIKISQHKPLISSRSLSPLFLLPPVFISPFVSLLIPISPSSCSLCLISIAYLNSTFPHFTDPSLISSFLFLPSSFPCSSFPTSQIMYLNKS